MTSDLHTSSDLGHFFSYLVPVALSMSLVSTFSLLAGIAKEMASWSFQGK